MISSCRRLLLRRKHRQNRSQRRKPPGRLQKAPLCLPVEAFFREDLGCAKGFKTAIFHVLTIAHFIKHYRDPVHLYTGFR